MKMISECERIIQESFYKLGYAQDRLSNLGIHGRVLRFEMSKATYEALKSRSPIDIDGSRATLFGNKILINDDLLRGQVNVLGVEA